MTPLPLLLAVALLAAEAKDEGRPAPVPEEAPPSPALAPPAPLPPLEVAPPPAAPPAPATPQPWTRPLSVAAGLSLLRFDGVPVSLGTVRLGITGLRAPTEPRSAQLGFAMIFEAVGGQTENGLEVGGVTVGPHLVAAMDRFRASGGVEIGLYGIRRATAGTATLATGYFRGELQLDVWRLEQSTIYLGATGSFGGGGDIPFRGWAGFLGLRM